MQNIPLKDLQTRRHSESRRPYSSISDATNSRRRHTKMGTLRVTFSYVFDWAVLFAFAVAGFFLGNLSPNKRPFDLGDPNISFPLHDDTVSILNAFLACVVAPILVVILVTLLLTPGSMGVPGRPRSFTLRRKIWELHSGLLGLVFSVVATWFIVSTTKNLLGKPRPNALARCQPDLENIAQYIVGGVAATSSFAAGQLVSADICKNPDAGVVNEGFRSFPSGHSSIAASGLVYLTLFLASKFGVTAPWATPRTDGLSKTSYSTVPPRTDGAVAADKFETPPLEARGTLPTPPARRQAAAPPMYLVILALIPFGGCVFICASRWYDFQHHGFDILFAFGIGATTSYFGFRLYHLPMGQGTGWAAAPRSEDAAFGSGVGTQGYGHGLDRTRQDSMC
ncbi:pap2 domain containing protein [Colletotrichum musicola]|uniref:Pap2 domain containing protein n=1 Tax=Colletotrichum musicola TaxID=2175873 RepID=A0A8H6NC41_9PEZI|nr:pap2 domain containing protein [Colletotrichum musicola]